MFAEGPWPQIRASLERQGWNHAQIERIHDHLRHGWPLRLAQHNVAAISGHCPLRSGRQTWGRCLGTEPLWASMQGLVEA